MLKEAASLYRNFFRDPLRPLSSHQTRISIAHFEFCFSSMLVRLATKKHFAWQTHLLFNVLETFQNIFCFSRKQKMFVKHMFV